MKNIYLIPTDKESRLWRDLDSKKLTFSNLSKPNSNECTKCSNEYMYITSKDEIKVGSIVKIPCGVGVVKELHWKYGNDDPSYIVEDLFVSELRYGQKEGELQINSFRYDDCKLIVLTTDPLLIRDGIQEIEDDVMEWFVENPTCEYFNIEQYNSYGVDNWKYLITLPTNGVDFGKELSKWGYNKGNSIDVEILVNEILPELFKQFNK